MNRISTTKTITVIILLLFGIHLQSKAQGLPKLIIRILNFENEKGVAVIHLFRETDDIPDNPFKVVKGKITNHAVEIVIENLPIESYAVIAFHDENSNGILDHKFGFPNEPMGFSNNWDLGLFTGMPTFKKLKFDCNSAQTIVEIKID